MANEIVTRTERIILVQVNKNTKEERVLFKDKYGGGFQPTYTVANATPFNKQEDAEKISQTLNMLYNMTESEFECHVAKEIVERTYLDGGLTENDKNSEEPTSNVSK